MRLKQIVADLPDLLGAGRSLLAALATTLVLSACGDNPDDLVASARKELAAKDYRTAILHLKTALQKDANHKVARYELGTALRSTGDLAGAEKELRRAIELGYDRGAASRELAHVVYSQGRIDDFIKEFADLQLGSVEETAEIKALIGNALFARRKVDEAVKAYEEALRLFPGNVAARVGQARVAAMRGDVAGAHAILDEVLTKAPKDQEALLVRAALFNAKGDRENTIATYRKLIEYYPENLGGHYSLFSQMLEAGRIDDAKAVADGMVKVAPDDARTQHVLAMLAYQSKDYTKAQEYALKALSRAPSFPPAQLVAGAASLQLGNFQQAIQYLTEVVRTQKRNLFAHQLLISAHMGARDLQRANRALKEAIELFPDDPKLLLQAGELAARERKIGDAAKYFGMSAEKGETSGLAQLRLGQALLAEGKESEGLRVLEESAKASGAGTRSDVALVLHHMRRGEMDKALEWISNLDKKRPGTALVPTLRGVVSIGKRDPAGARKHFEQALQIDGASATALMYLARLDISENKADAAKRRYQDASARYPQNEQVAIDHVRLLATVDKNSDALAEPLQQFVKANPNAERARAALVEALMVGSDRGKAVAAAREAVAALPGSVNLKMTLGQVLRATGENNQAIAAYADVLRTNPKSLPALLASAQAYAAMGDSARSVEFLDRAIEMVPGNLDLKRMKVVALMKSKQVEQALSLAREMRLKNPKQSIGYETESTVLVGMDKWNEAADVLQTGFREAPSATMLVRLHAALDQAGRKDQAAQAAAKWIASNPKDVQVRAYLGERFAMAGDHQAALRYYQEAIAIAPKNALLLNNLAWSADQIKDPKALQYAEEANKLAPDSPAIMDTLGWMLVQRGNSPRGLELLEKASKGAPQALSIRYNYAQALIKAGRKDDARKELDFLKSQGERFKQRAELDALYKQL